MISVSDHAGSTNADLFAQQFPGSIGIQFRMDYASHVTEPPVLENSFAGNWRRNCGTVLDWSPYGPWPEDKIVERFEA